MNCYTSLLILVTWCFTPLLADECVLNVCPSSAFGMYRHCSDCTIFVMCVGSMVIPIGCPVGLRYDTSLAVCNYASQTPCVTGISSNPTSPTSVTSPTSMTSPTSVTSPTSITSPTSMTSQTSATSPTSVTSPTSATSMTSPTSVTSPTSATSPTSVTSPTSGTSPTSPSPCIINCFGKNNGDFQSCFSCNTYATCSGGTLIDKRPCAGSLVWDDLAKVCQQTSSTCR